jgi:prephenate dehydrogenase
MSQNGRLYAEIQANNQLNQKMQEIFINVAKDFNKLIFKDKDLDSFVAKLEE